MRLMSGRLREYEVTIPATTPAKSNPPNTAMTSNPRSTPASRFPPARPRREPRRVARGRTPEATLVGAPLSFRHERSAREHAVDEAAGVFGGEFLCKLNGFV